MRRVGLVAVVILSAVGLGLPRAKAAERGVSAYDYVRQHGWVTFPDHAPKHRASTKAWDYSVGDTRSFWSWDLSVMPPSDIQVPATCRAVGAYVYVFVADDLWGADVQQADVDAVLAALETTTPAGSIHPARGIVPNEYEVFGPAPDVLDDDPRVFILLMELKKYGGTAFDGFFNAYNQYPDAETMADYGYHSNELEMVTVNATIRPAASETTLGILAHEFQHLIHWGGDVGEVAWVDESCAEAAMTINGYLTDDDWLADYMGAPSAALKEAQYVHYGACLLFGSYLYERFGAAFMTALVAEDAHGDAGLQATLDAQADGLALDALELDWATATLADALGAQDPRFAHPLLDAGMPALAHTVSGYPAAGLGGSLDPSGAAYLRLQKPAEGQDLAVTWTAGEVRLRAVWGQGAELQVADTDDQHSLLIPFSQAPGLDQAYLVVYASGAARTTWNLDVAAVGGQVEPDGGTPDGGDADAGGDDAGPQDGSTGADEADGGGSPPENDGGGCGCAAAGASSFAWLGLAGLALMVLRRRARQSKGQAGHRRESR